MVKNIGHPRQQGKTEKLKRQVQETAELEHGHCFGQWQGSKNHMMALCEACSCCIVIDHGEVRGTALTVPCNGNVPDDSFIEGEIA